MRIPGVLNRGECVDSMLICRAFGVFAPKVYRGVLKMGVPESKQGMCPHPIRGSSTAVVRSGYADHSPPPFAPRQPYGTVPVPTSSRAYY